MKFGHCQLKQISNLLISIVVFTYSTGAFALWKPDYGDLFYDGQYFLDSLFRWRSPGPWPSGSGVGYEHDLATGGEFLTGFVTVVGNLPDFYDDTPTQGILDPAGVRISSGGTYDVLQIVANFPYVIGWGFLPVQPVTTSADI